ncbi:MAG TPA: alpha/beta fold hydrolase [Acidimicrobiales bacterium]|nr:alpha/beta fold hydrolase [Acidimicrobiales bacterium]
MPDPTYVLVHGGWGGAWVWRDLGAELTRREVAWTAVDLPSSTHGAHPNTFLSDDAREVAAVANAEGPVVLVGHSYGGAVLCEVAQDVADLQRLVYVAALVPLLGESATEATREVRARTLLDEAIQVEGDFLTLDPALAKNALYQDCDEETADWALTQLTAQTIASFRSPRSSFEVDVPSYYVRCTLDNAVDLSVQELMAARCSEFATLESGHSPMFSMPEALCDLILAAT